MIDRLVLALDGSTRTCSAALVRRRAPAVAAGAPGPTAGDQGWETVARRTEKDGRGQARVLLTMVDQMLAEVGGTAADLGGVVVGTGPGTFTGVRITVATGRALGLALAVPVLGVSTLAALAVRGVVEGGGSSTLVIPAVDARRQQVFCAVYEATAGKAPGGATGGYPGPRWARRGGFEVCDRGDLGAVLTRPSVIVAEDLSVVGRLPCDTVFVAADVRAEELVIGQSLLEEPGEGPSGWRLGPWLSVALDLGPRVSRGHEIPGQVRPGGVGTPESVKPIYVRSPDADVHITKRRDPWAADPIRPERAGAG